MKIAAKLILNVAHHGWEMKKITHFTFSKLVLNDIFLPFYLNEKQWICMLYQKILQKINYIKELSKII